MSGRRKMRPRPRCARCGRTWQLPCDRPAGLLVLCSRCERRERVVWWVALSVVALFVCVGLWWGIAE